MDTAIDHVRYHGGNIVFVRIAFDYLDYVGTPSTNEEFSSASRDRRFQNWTGGTNLHPGLAIEADDIVVRKTRLGAFSTTDLNEQLTNRGITTLIIAGASTSGTVLSTIREAADRDYRLIVLPECTSDPDAGVHDLLIKHIFPRQATIATLDELSRWLIAGRAEASTSTASTGDRQSEMSRP